MFKSLLFFCLIVLYSAESPAAAKDRMVMPNFTPKVTWSTKGTTSSRSGSGGRAAKPTVLKAGGFAAAFGSDSDSD